MAEIFHSFPVPPLQANCTIVIDPVSKEALVADPGDGTLDVIRYTRQNGARLKYIVLTHSHFDHAGSKLHELKEAYPDSLIVIHESGAELYDQLGNQPRMFGMPGVANPPPVDLKLRSGQSLMLGELEVQTIHSPGHSPGSICLHIPSHELLIAGDVLFRGSVGRSDLWGGDPRILRRSVKELLTQLPPTTRVMTGHGPATDIAYERRRNPYA